MYVRSTVNKRLPVIAAACLLSVALPAGGAIAKEKTKGTSKPAPAISVSYDVSIPSVDAVGSNVDEATLKDILGGNIAANADTMATLDADSISVPEIIVTVASDRADDSETAAFTIAGLTLENVVDGVAGSVSLDSVTMTTDEASMNFGTMSAANFDIGGMLGVYGLVDTTGQTALETIYTDFSSTGGTLEAEDVSCTIGAVSGSEFKARPLRTSFGEIMALAESAAEAEDDMDPALMGKILHMYADIMTAFETSEVTFDGMSCSGEDNDGRPMTFDIAGMVMGGMSPGYYPSISLDGFNVTVEGDGAVSFGNFTFKPMDLRGTIATMEAAPDMVDEVWLEENARMLIPAMEGLSLTDLDIDIPDPDNDGERIQAQVGNFDLTLADYINGIPSVLDMSAASIKAELPKDSDDETWAQLEALGITSIDAGFRIAAAWKDDTDTIDIEEVSLNGVDLASVLLAGTIANATSDLFALDPDTALAAAMGVAVKSLNLTLVDAGLNDIAIAAIAADQGGDPATMRSIYADLAKGSIISMLAGVADAAKLGDAVSAFIAGSAKTLNIGIEAKEEPGLGLMDFMEAEENPMSILGKVNVSAEAK